MADTKPEPKKKDIRTITVRLYPDKKERMALESALNGCRLLYNHLLEMCIIIHKLEQPYPGKYGMYEITKAVRPLIPDDCIRYMYSQVQQDVGFRLDLAFQKFFDRCKKEEGKGFPRFKGKNRMRSFAYTQSGFRLDEKNSISARSAISGSEDTRTFRE